MELKSINYRGWIIELFDKSTMIQSPKGETMTQKEIESLFHGRRYAWYEDDEDLIRMSKRGGRKPKKRTQIFVYNTPEFLELRRTKKLNRGLLESNPDFQLIRDFIDARYGPQEDNGDKGKGIAQYTKDGKLLNTFMTMKAAEDVTGVPMSYISNCVHGRQKTAGNYVWKWSE